MIKMVYVFPVNNHLSSTENLVLYMVVQSILIQDAINAKILAKNKETDVLFHFVKFIKTASQVAKNVPQAIKWYKEDVLGKTPNASNIVNQDNVRVVQNNLLFSREYVSRKIFTVQFIQSKEDVTNVNIDIMFLLI